MGGSGWGEIISLKWTSVPKRKPESTEPNPLPGGVSEYAEIYKTALAGLKIYGANARSSYLCASPDGRKVFFAIREEATENAQKSGLEVKFYLGDDTGAVRSLDQLKSADPD